VALLALIPGQPAAPADIAGLITWFVLTGRKRPGTTAGTVEDKAERPEGSRPDQIGEAASVDLHPDGDLNGSDFVFRGQHPEKPVVAPSVVEHVNVVFRDPAYLFS
jgi:hypothetical protein